jgi:diguanylate cyclase (GGDEF)-like protein
MTSADRDELTKLPGRESFEQSFAQALAKADSGAITLALIDVDNFASLNRSHGHAGGDAALKAVADALSAMPGALLARYGGDEFVALFIGVEREQAFLRLEKAREALAALEALSVDGKSEALRLSISTGAAAYPIDGTNEAELMRKADGALYRAKISGRDKVMLAFEEKMAPKTAHFTVTQLERLAELAKDQGVGEAVLLREALDDLLVKYIHGFRRDR